VLSHVGTRWRDFKARLTRLYVFGDNMILLVWSTQSLRRIKCIFVHVESLRIDKFSSWNLFIVTLVTHFWIKVIKQCYVCDREKWQQPKKDKGLMIHCTYSLRWLCTIREKKMKKSRAQALGLESPNEVPAIPRYELWKAARTKSDGIMTS